MITNKALLTVRIFNDLRAFLGLDIGHNKNIDNPGGLHLKNIDNGSYD